jgi:hypothetical protein
MGRGLKEDFWGCGECLRIGDYGEFGADLLLAK